MTQGLYESHLRVAATSRKVAQKRQQNETLLPLLLEVNAIIQTPVTFAASKGINRIASIGKQVAKCFYYLKTQARMVATPPLAATYMQRENAPTQNTTNLDW